MNTLVTQRQLQDYIGRTTPVINARGSVATGSLGSRINFAQTREYRSSDSYPWRIWTETSGDTSGNSQVYWMCAEQWRARPEGTDTPELAGDLINNQYVYFPVTGTAWTEISASTAVYLNVRKDDNDSLSGEVATSAVATNLSGNPMTYAIELAHLQMVSGNMVVYQEQDVDITDVSVLGTSAQLFNHPYKTWLRYSDATSGFEYGVSQIYADNVDIAGYIYSEDKTRYTVSGIPWTPISGDVNLFLNVTNIDISTATGYVADAPVAVQLDPTRARTWPILIAEITNASDPNLMVRKYEDYHLASLSGVNENHPYKIWMYNTPSGHQWHCNEVNQPDQWAGYIYTNNMTRNSVLGTSLNDVSSDTEIYCNVTQMSRTEASGIIETSAIAVSITSGFPLTFPIHVADITFVDDVATVVQRYYNDIYTSYYETSAMVPSAVIDVYYNDLTGSTDYDPRHPYKTWLKEETDISGNATYAYAVSQFNAHVDTSIAGYLYSDDHLTKYEVSGIPWTPIDADTNLYLNVWYNDVNEVSGVVTDQQIASHTNDVSGTYNVLISEITFVAGVPNCLVRKYEDEYVVNDVTSENHPYKIWMVKDTSGNYNWHCNQINSESNYAGYIYTNNMSRNVVSGTSFVGVNSDTEIYCNVIQTSKTEASGQIETFAIGTSVTSGFPLTFPIHVADIKFDSTSATLVQRYYDDIYTSYYETSANTPSAVIDIVNQYITSGITDVTGNPDFDIRHPYKAWLRSSPNISGNTEWEYAVSQFDAHLDTSIAGNVYPQDHVSKFEVTGIPWTSVSGDLDIYLNVKYDSLYTASGWVTTSRIEDSNYLPNGQYNVLLSEIRFTSGDATCLNRKFEDEYVTVDNNDNFSFKVWLKKDVSGNNYWRCSDVSDDESTAGTLYSSNLTPANVGGIDWTLLNDDEIVYCNVTQSSSGEASGYIDTSPISKSIEDYPCTFAVPIADITYNDGYPVLVQRINNDLYTDNYIPTAGGTSNRHPWQISTRVNSGNQQYSIAAGAVYNFAGTLVTVAAVDWTTITATKLLYLNLSYSSGTLTITVSETAATEAPYGSTGTWSVRIGVVTIAGGVITDVLQTLHDYYDIRGRVIPAAIAGFTYANQQVLTHYSSGSPAWVDVKTCASGA